MNEFETAIFAGGCFWCTEAIFKEINGVEEIVSGYIGGSTENPSYEDVCSGTTGHAEAIQIKFRPAVVSYEDLLRIFFTTHDPTTLNRQGSDVGTQYRSAVFYVDETQKNSAEKIKQEIEDSKIYSDPIVTEISPLKTFYPAEDYHQNYLKKYPNQGYCLVIINPKVIKFRQKFKDKLKR